MNDLEREYAAALRISTGEILQWKPRVNNSIHSIVVSNTAVFMSGLFDTVSGSYQKRIARVSKGQGELQPWPKPIPDRLTNHFSFYINKKILLWKDQLFTVNGSMNIETAEEGIWKPSPLLLEKPGHPFFIADMTIVGGVIYTVGFFSSMNDEPRNGMAAFSAESGKVLPWNPNKGWQPTADRVVPTLYFIQVVDTIAYCAGSINNIGGIPVRGIGAVATTTGQLLPWNPSVSNYTRINRNSIIDLVSPGFLGASEDGVLMAISGIGTIGQPLTARSGIAEVDLRTGALSPWDPGFRSRMDPDSFYLTYTHIHALALQGSTLYVGGVFDSVGGVPRSRLCAFDATTHELLPWNPSVVNGEYPDSVIQDIVATPQAIYIMGTFDSIGGVAQRYIAAVDPQSGALLPFQANPNRPVAAMAYSDGRLYVGGLFSTIGGKPRNGFAVLDGVSGEALEEGPMFPPRATVQSLAVGDTLVYVSGIRLGKEVTPMIRPIIGDGSGFGGYDRTSGELRWLPKYPVPTNTGAARLELSPRGLMVSGWFSRKSYQSLPGQWDSSNGGMMRLDARSGEVKGEWPLIGGSNFVEWSDTLLIWEESPDEQQGIRIPYLALLTNEQSSGVVVGRVAMEGSGELRAYPNPSSGRVRVECEGGCEGKEVEVVNQYGERVMQQGFGEGGECVLDLGGLSNGVYLVRIGTRSAAIVVQR